MPNCLGHDKHPIMRPG